MTTFYKLHSCTFSELPTISPETLAARLAKQAAEREEALQCLRSLRKEAAAEIERLLEFMDASDLDPDLEETADGEPSLGWSTLAIAAALTT
jgi:hypothetical protein